MIYFNTKEPGLPNRADPLIEVFINKMQELFPSRIVSIFKFGSLGEHGDFSLCSDVDVVLMLDTLTEEDDEKITKTWNEIKNIKIEFADRLSVFWSTYDVELFSRGVGRFPALDRLDFIRHAKLIRGEDRRSSLPPPSQRNIVIESAEFISKYMLTAEKLNELLHNTDMIVNKGARYFSKFVLFPVRLIFTLDNPNCIGSNREAVEYFEKKHSEIISDGTITLIKNAYAFRNSHPDTCESSIDFSNLQTELIELYQYCIERYRDEMNKFRQDDMADSLTHYLTTLSGDSQNIKTI